MNGESFGFHVSVVVVVVVSCLSSESYSVECLLKLEDENLLADDREALLYLLNLVTLAGMNFVRLLLDMTLLLLKSTATAADRLGR